MLGSSRFSGKAEGLTWEMGRNGACYAAAGTTAQITPETITVTADTPYCWMPQFALLPLTARDRATAPGHCCHCSRPLRKSTLSQLLLSDVTSSRCAVWSTCTWLVDLRSRAPVLTTRGAGTANAVPPGEVSTVENGLCFLKIFVRGAVLRTGREVWC